MPKKRKIENNGLPKRWRMRSGGYYYRVPKGEEENWEGKTEYLLGHSLTSAYRVYADKIELNNDAKTIGDLLGLYELKEISKKSFGTRERETRLLPDLHGVYAHMPISSLKPRHVYQFKTKVGEQRGEATANRMISILSHAYTKAIEWGLCDEHPIKNKVIRFSIKPRDRYVEDWELKEAFSVAPELIKKYIPIKSLTALRRSDILSIKKTDLKEDGIHIKQNKTGKAIIIQWSDELFEAVESVKKECKKISSIYLFNTSNGQPYIKENGRTNGFNSAWKRWQEKAIKETKLKNKFSESDLRAKTASDTTEQHAFELLDHSTSDVTRRHYRRKPKVVKPFSLNNILH